MYGSRLLRSAGVVTMAVAAAALVGAQPASADITVDSAVCLNGATSTLTSPNAAIVINRANKEVDPVVTWHATLPTYCSTANASLSLVRQNVVIVAGLPANSSKVLQSTGTWTLHLQTSMGGKDLASIYIDFYVEYPL